MPLIKSFKEMSPKKRKRLIDDILDTLRVVCVTFIVIIICHTFIGRIAWVDGQSMETTLYDGDMLILWSLGYSPAQGDIVACNSYGLGKVIIKRIVAVGGQEVTIDFNAGKVYVDGKEFLVDGIENITTRNEGRAVEHLRVPSGKYFVMGDNRQHSTDSRDERVGFIDRDDILGKALLRVLPPKPINNRMITE